jgi:hypothetical protein
MEDMYHKGPGGCQVGSCVCGGADPDRHRHEHEAENSQATEGIGGAADGAFAAALVQAVIFDEPGAGILYGSGVVLNDGATNVYLGEAIWGVAVGDDSAASNGITNAFYNLAGGVYLPGGPVNAKAIYSVAWDIGAKPVTHFLGKVLHGIVNCC